MRSGVRPWAVGTLFAVLLSARGAVAIVLVQDGAPKASIVVAARALAPSKDDAGAQKIALAARDLQETIRKMSGAALPIIGDDAKPAGPVVLVGVSRLTEPGPVPHGLTPKRNEEGYIVICRGDRLEIAGNDEGPYHGTEYAVSDLLERLGVRWYMPGEYGEIVPLRPTVEIGDLNVREKPDFRMRNWWCHIGSPQAEEERRWKIHNRMNPDIVIALPGDSSIREFVAAPDEAKTHPELFAKNLDGSANPYLPNLTSPQAVQTAADKMKAYFRSHPAEQSKGIAPDDGLPRDFTAATAKLNQNFPELGGREGEPTEVSTSEEWFTFVNAVTREVKKEFPDRIVSTNGYANRDIPPQGVPLDPNIAVMYAAIWCDTLHAYDDPKSWQMVRQGQNLERWGRLCDKVFLYGYDYTMLVSALTPLPTTRKLVRDLPLLKKWGMIGFHDETRNVWAECGIPTKYIRARLEWNAKAKVAILLAEFYANWYGAAAKPAQAFWDDIEEAIEASPMLGHEDRVMPFVYTATLLGKLKADIEEAERLADSDRTKLHVRADRLIFDHLADYMRMNAAESEGDFAAAAKNAEDMLAIRPQLNAINPFYCQPGENGYETGVWYWRVTDRAAYYHKLVDMTTGKTGDLISLLPEKADFRVDPHDDGRFAGWYEPESGSSGWSTILTTKPFYMQGYVAPNGYPYVGPMWYRFRVNVPESARGRKIILFTPVVETEAWGWVNGKYAGHRPYREAYERPNELALDVTNAIEPGKLNTVVLRVHTSLNPAVAAGGLGSRVFLFAPK